MARSVLRRHSRTGRLKTTNIWYFPHCPSDNGRAEPCSRTSPSKPVTGCGELGDIQENELREPGAGASGPISASGRAPGLAAAMFTAVAMATPAPLAPQDPRQPP